VIRSLRGLRLFERQTRHSELIHLAGIAIPMLAVLQGADDPLLELGLWAVVLVNVHPFLLQRYNRARIHRVLERARVFANRRPAGYRPTGKHPPS
jgi:hypothetical protein